MDGRQAPGRAGHPKKFVNRFKGTNKVDSVRQIRPIKNSVSNTTAPELARELCGLTVAEMPPAPLSRPMGETTHISNANTCIIKGEVAHG